MHGSLPTNSLKITANSNQPEVKAWHEKMMLALKNRANIKNEADFIQQLAPMLKSRGIMPQDDLVDQDGDIILIEGLDYLRHWYQGNNIPRCEEIHDTLLEICNLPVPSRKCKASSDAERLTKEISKNLVDLWKEAQKVLDETPPYYPPLKPLKPDNRVTKGTGFKKLRREGLAKDNESNLVHVYNDRATGPRVHDLTKAPDYRVLADSGDFKKLRSIHEKTENFH